MSARRVVSEHRVARPYKEHTQHESVPLMFGSTYDAPDRPVLRQGLLPLNFNREAMPLCLMAAHKNCFKQFSAAGRMIQRWVQDVSSLLLPAAAAVLSLIDMANHKTTMNSSLS